MKKSIKKLLENSINFSTISERLETYIELFNLEDFEKYDIFSENSQFFSNKIELDDSIFPLITFEIVINDILKSKILCLIILRNYMENNICKTMSNNNLSNSFLKNMIIFLVNTNFIPNNYFDCWANLNNRFSKLINNDEILTSLLLDSKKLSFEKFQTQLPEDLTENNKIIIKKSMNEYLKLRNLKSKHLQQILKIIYEDDNKKILIETLDNDSLQLLVEHLLSLTGSFQLSNNNKNSENNYFNKFECNCLLFLNYLSSNISPKIIIETLTKNDHNIKMKDMLSISIVKEIFINKMKLFPFELMNVLCELKGSTITKLCFVNIVENLTGDKFEEYLNNDSYCTNFIILCKICKGSILELIKKNNFKKENVEKLLKLVYSLYPNISHIISLDLIEEFNLYDCVPDSIIKKLGFEMLTNYLNSIEDDNCEKLEYYSVDLVKRIVFDNIEFIDYVTIITLLSNLYIENINDILKIASLNKFILDLKIYMCKYDVVDVSKLITKMFFDPSIPMVFFSVFLECLPEVKKQIFKNISKKISVELYFEKLIIENAPNKNFSEFVYSLKMPLLNLYNGLVKNNNTNDNINNNINNNTNVNDMSYRDENKIFVELTGLLNSNIDIEVEMLKKMVTCKNYNNFEIDKHTCNICFDNEHEVVLIPCGHLLCSGCCEEYVKSKKKCPFCNKSNISCIKIYNL